MYFDMAPKAEYTPWKRVFAWRPIYLGSSKWVWLEFVERRKHYPWWESGSKFSFVEYRRVGSNDAD